MQMNAQQSNPQRNYKITPQAGGWTGRYALRMTGSDDLIEIRDGAVSAPAVFDDVPAARRFLQELVKDAAKALHASTGLEYGKAMHQVRTESIANVIIVAPGFFSLPVDETVHLIEFM